MKIKSLWFEKLSSKEVNDLLSIQFPIRIMYHIKRVVFDLRQQSKAYYNHKKELFEKYQVDGKIPEESFMQYANDIAVTCEIEVDINIDKIEVKLEDLPDMSVLQFEFIEPFLDIRTEK